MQVKAKSIRETEYKGAKIKYTLERKPVKNINLRIRTDGSVYVSANSRVPVRMIDDFVSSKGYYILNVQRKLEQIKAKEVQRQYINGESFVILGKTLYLKISKCSKDFVCSDDSYIYLNVRELSDFKKKEKLITQYTDQICKNVFTEMMKAMYPLFCSYTKSLPTLRIREMKTRWGSCIPKKNIITLNKRLIEKEASVIEYVVLHEYCHFVHPNHSKNFYALLASFMPDWKERKTALNS